MPKAAQYALVWLPAQQTYDLQRADTLIMSLPVDNPAWFAWLATQRAFAFRGQQGQLSLLKESRQSGGAGYCSRHHQPPWGTTHCRWMRRYQNRQQCA